MEDTADEAMTERAPSNGRERLMRAADEGEERRGGTLTQQSAPTVCSKSAGRYPRKVQKGNPPRGGHQTRKGVPSTRIERRGTQQEERSRGSPPNGSPRIM